MNEQNTQQKLVEEYWFKKLSGAYFPGAFYNREGGSKQQLSVSILLPEKIAGTVSSLAMNNPLGEYAIYLSIFGFLTGKYFRENKLLVYSPAIILEGQTGKMPLFHRLHIHTEEDLNNWIKEVSKEVQQGIGAGDCDYRILRNRFADRNIEEDLICSIGFCYMPLQDPVTNPDLIKWLLVLERSDKGQLLLTLRYSQHIAERQVAEDFLNRYSCLVQQLEMYLRVRISLNKVELLNTAERDEIFFSFNEPSIDFSKKSVVKLFEAQVGRVPALTALQCGEEKLTYGELDSLANRLSSYLFNDCGIHNGGIVAMLLDRSIDIGVAALGILKAGAAFLTIDPRLPVSRIRTILEDAQPGMIVTQSAHLSKLDGYEGGVFAMDVELATLPTSPKVCLPDCSPESPAYVLYTSGTTGMPKGAVINHEAVANLVKGLTAVFLPSAGRLQMAVVAAYVFDPFWKQFFLALLEGHALYIVPEEVKSDPTALWNYYSRYHIELTDGTPALLNLLVHDLPPLSLPLPLRYFMIGGESLQPKPLIKLFDYFRRRQSGIDVINEYGLTECCVDNICFLVDPLALQENTPVPIGKPLPNNHVLILDADNRLVPIGCQGQIGILGTGVGQGYLNHPELTASKFIDSPYNAFEGKLYLTGDIGKWQPDGNIVCLGRLDNQVKVNGYRIELGEVEAAMRKNLAIKDAVAVIREQDGKKVIAAYWTAHFHLTAATVRAELAKYLPEYMLPSCYCALEYMPLTVNGKIDKQALPDPWLSGSNGEASIAPATPMEVILVNIWEEILGVPDIGIRNDFFLNGGDSIKAIQMSSRLHGLGYKMEVRNVFQYPTIEKLALIIQKQDRVADQEPVTGEISLTPVQREFFAAHTQAPHHYNQSVLLKFPTHIPSEKIKAVFSALQSHHDALRIVFRQKSGGQWIQLNQEEGSPIALHEFDWREDGQVGERLNDTANRLQQLIDLGKGPLLQIGLFQLKTDSRLLIIVHHLIMDGVSFRILLEDVAALFTLYDKAEPLRLPLKTDSYKIWASKLIEYAGTGLFLKEKEYWRQQQQSIAELMAENKDKTEGAPVSVRYELELDPNVTALLTGKSNKAFNTEVQDILITSIVLAYRDIWQENRMAMVLEGHGREPITGDVDVSRTIGWFTSLYPVLFDIMNAKNPGEALIAVKETIRSVPAKGIGYGILKYLASAQSREGIPMDLNIPVIFNYLGHFDTNWQNELFVWSDEPHGQERSDAGSPAYAMEITAVISDGRLYMGLGCRGLKREPGSISAFRDRLYQRLNELILYTAAIEQVRLTPSDLTWKKFSGPELEAICREYDVQDIYPLSPMQEGILFSCLYNEKAPLYMEQLSYRTKYPALDPGLVRSSIDKLISRHDILRTVFLYENLERPMQVVLKKQKPIWSFEDLRDRTDKDEYIRHFKKKDRQLPFDLRNDSLLRVAIFQIGKDEYEFVWIHHHLLMDAWCEGILIQEYYAIYNYLSKGIEINLPPPQPYNTYINWIEEQEKEDATAYWRNYLSSFEKCTSLPVKPPENDKQLPGEKKMQQFLFDTMTTASLGMLAARYKVTVNTIIQCVWGILLSRYNNTRDVVFGIVVAGRPSAIPHVDSIVGLFINTIPVRIRFNEGSSFSALVKEVQLQALESELYQHKSLSEIQLLSGHQPLLDHIMLFDNYPSTETRLGDRQQQMDAGIPEVYDMHIHENPHYDLNVRIIPGRNLTFRLDYNGKVYAMDTIARILSQVEQLIREVLAEPEQLISALNMVPPEEKAQLEAFSRGPEVIRPEMNIIDRFEAWAATSPDRVALVYQNKRITYSELHQHSGVLAYHLKKISGTAKGQVVGIMMERTDLMVMAVLGILKAGAAFLPVDMALPEERKAFLLKDAEVRLLITTSDCLFSLGEQYHHELIALDLLDMNNGQYAAIDKINSKNSLAYILYTSGSSGSPKGVEIGMAGLVNYLEWANEYYFGNSTGHCFGLFTSLSFDLSITALFSGLLRGDKIAIFDSQWDTAELLSYLFEQQDEVNTLKMTPSHIDVLAKLSLERCSIQTVILGGEQIKTSHVKLLKKLNPSIRLFNEYGPTETTVGCSIKEVGETDEITNIGRPIFNTRIHILNSSFRLQPIEGLGEIFVAGAGVARGYLHQKELTREKFITLPDISPEILYRTGDQGRWNRDGELEYRGRLDDQFKIRGYRIETAEIEKAMTSLPYVAAAIVTAWADKEGNNELACYYTLRTPLPAAAIRQHLTTILPGYMIPSYLIELDEIPLTVNGKISRRELPSPYNNRIDADETDQLPENDTESRLLEIWKEVLDTGKISVCDNFFTLGGNSLKIVRLYDLIQRTLNVNIRISQLFDNPTIRQQSEIVRAGSDDLQESLRAATVIDF